MEHTFGFACPGVHNSVPKTFGARKNILETPNIPETMKINNSVYCSSVQRLFMLNDSRYEVLAWLSPLRLVFTHSHHLNLEREVFSLH